MATNALAYEKSPYLRQHANNPVQWLPWGEAAFAKAREEDKPIFLSIGYSTCHWCHVMAHESFEDPQTAEVLNRYFVPVKIDREERPDIDRVYMLFVQASTGGGGWPLSVWLTPDLKPFFGGTYFPPGDRYGRPGFRSLLEHLGRAWRDDRDRILDSSSNVTEQLAAITSQRKEGVTLDRELADAAYWQLRRTYDARYGGFGAAPKFPRPAVLLYLLRQYALSKNEEALEMVTHTLRAMAAGGMYDQLGGGFHRYSVDERWFVPHFEKMLYDQGQLAMAYLEAYQATGDPFFASVVNDTLSYVLRDLRGPQGAFYSAEDADSADPEEPSRHGEGAFYLWREAEIRRLLGETAAREFCDAFGVLPNGNVDVDPHGEFTGRNILYRTKPGEYDTPQLRQAREVLFQAREKRPRPHLDNKILTGWNALMISALARSGAVLNRTDYIDAARVASLFLLQTMYNPANGSLLRRFCDGEAGIAAFADDYAFFAQSLLDLFEVTGEAQFLSFAADLCRRGLLRFWDENEGGFFSTEAGEADVLLRLKDDYDGAEPAANSVAADVLLRVTHLTGQPEYEQSARETLQWLSPRLRSQPVMAPQALAAVMRSLAEPGQVVIRCHSVDNKARDVLADNLRKFDPFTSVLLLPDAANTELHTVAPFFASLERKGNLTRYECRNFTCQLPEVVA